LYGIAHHSELPKAISREIIQECGSEPEPEDTINREANQDENRPWPTSLEMAVKQDNRICKEFHQEKLLEQY
jgi:hypothetical protein